MPWQLNNVTNITFSWIREIRRASGYWLEYESAIGLHEFSSKHTGIFLFPLEKTLYNWANKLLSQQILWPDRLIVIMNYLEAILCCEWQDAETWSKNWLPWDLVSTLQLTLRPTNPLIASFTNHNAGVFGESWIVSIIALDTMTLSTDISPFNISKLVIHKLNATVKSPVA